MIQAFHKLASTSFTSVGSLSSVCHQFNSLLEQYSNQLGADSAFLFSMKIFLRKFEHIVHTVVFQDSVDVLQKLDLLMKSINICYEHRDFESCFVYLESAKRSLLKLDMKMEAAMCDKEALGVLKYQSLFESTSAAKESDLVNKVISSYDSALLPERIIEIKIENLKRCKESMDLEASLRLEEEILDLKLQVFKYVWRNL